MDVPGNQPWRNVPNVNFNRDNRKVKLNANSDDNANDNWSVPSSRECACRRDAVKASFLLLGKRFHPPAEHLSDFMEFRFHGKVLFVREAGAVFCETYEQLGDINLGACFAKRIRFLYTILCAGRRKHGFQRI